MMEEYIKKFPKEPSFERGTFFKGFATKEMINKFNLKEEK